MPRPLLTPQPAACNSAGRSTRCCPPADGAGGWSLSTIVLWQHTRTGPGGILVRSHGAPTLPTLARAATFFPRPSTRSRAPAAVPPPLPVPPSACDCRRRRREATDSGRFSSAARRPPRDGSAPSSGGAPTTTPDHAARLLTRLACHPRRVQAPHQLLYLACRGPPMMACHGAQEGGTAERGPAVSLLGWVRGGGGASVVRTAAGHWVVQRAAAGGGSMYGPPPVGLGAGGGGGGSRTRRRTARSPLATGDCTGGGAGRQSVGGGGGRSPSPYRGWSLGGSAPAWPLRSRCFVSPRSVWRPPSPLCH